MYPRLVPECELNTIVDSECAVDLANVVSDDITAHSQFLGDFAVFQSPGHQFDDSQLLAAGFWEGGSYHQQLTKLVSKCLQSFQIFLDSNQSEKLANSLVLWGRHTKGLESLSGSKTTGQAVERREGPGGIVIPR